jgi:hypothetical protein
MRFPVHVYRVPGRFKKPGGGSYDYTQAVSQEHFDTLLTRGWFPSYAEAKIGKIEAPEVIDEVSPPTREELEDKARELGVSFNARTSDKKLAERIAEALEA